MSAKADSLLNALLELSDNAPLAAARRTLLRSISDDDLSQLLWRGMGREFARGGMEEIFLLMLDVIARDPGTTGAKKGKTSIECRLAQGSKKQLESRIDTSDEPAAKAPAVTKSSSASTQPRSGHVLG
jgi:hypothetical protein